MASTTKYVDKQALADFSKKIRLLMDKRIWTDLGYEIGLDTNAPADKTLYLWGKYALYDATTSSYKAEEKKKICALPTTVKSGEVKDTKDIDGKIEKSIIELTLSDDTTVKIDITAIAKSIEKNTDDIAKLNDTVDVVGSVKNSIKTFAKDANSGVKGYELIADPTQIILPSAYAALDPTSQALYQLSSKDITIEQSIEDAKEAATKGSVVTVKKQSEAEDTFAATYWVMQNGEKVGDSINIPKDFLVKDAKLETCIQDDTPVVGYKVGDKYIDFIINAIDETSTTTEKHIYLLVTDLIDVYTGKEVENGISVKLDENNKISAEVSGKAIARANITDEFEANIKALEDTHSKKADDSFNTVTEQINAEAKDGIYKAATEIESAVTIAEGIKNVEDLLADFVPVESADIDNLFPELN